MFGIALEKDNHHRPFVVSLLNLTLVQLNYDQGLLPKEGKSLPGSPGG
jgi:hypothetical protein